MNNKEILDMNNGKKFDICLQNPPYGDKGANNIHLDFINKCKDISKEVIAIIPISFVLRNSGQFKKYKKDWNSYLYNIEEVDSSLFKNTNMQNLGIYQLNKDKCNKLIINYLNKNTEIIDGILNKNYSNFSNYEENIIKYIKKDRNIYKIFGYTGNEDKYTFDEYLNSKLKRLNKIVLICSSMGDKNNPQYYNSNLGQIFNHHEFIDFVLNNKKRTFITLDFNDKKSAENCKIALKNPLLRFALLRSQTDRHINKLQYSYIPDINWSDDRVKTDEGLLEVCGCPKDKCKEYTEYCKKIIEEVDKK